jgi:hypothetical protein
VDYNILSAKTGPLLYQVIRLFYVRSFPGLSGVDTQDTLPLSARSFAHTSYSK